MNHRGGLTPFSGGDFAPLFGLRRELERVFDDAGRTRAGPWAPAVDVRENEREIRLDVELPGMSADNVEIDVEQGVLTVRGERNVEHEKEDEGGRFHILERSYGSFVRTFTLPRGVQEERIEADYDKGVLTIRIPKGDEPRGRKIRVGKGREGSQQRQMSGEKPSEERSAGEKSSGEDRNPEQRSASRKSSGSKRGARPD